MSRDAKQGMIGLAAIATAAVGVYLEFGVGWMLIVLGGIFTAGICYARTK